MSWEEDYKHESPCFCGKGTKVSWSESDDWNRHRGGEYLTCEDCKQKYVYEFVDLRSEALRKTDGYAWITKEEFADYQKKQKEERAKRKELHMQQLQQRVSNWNSRHSLEWFELMDEYMILYGKKDTEEYKNFLEEFHQYETKLDSRHKGKPKSRRPSIGNTRYYYED
jgi:hypothetical protein